MKQRTRILIYILIAIAAVILGTIAILTNHNADKPVTAEEHLDLGRIYLNELSYENAVLEFNEAIEIEPLNADAYLGLAQAYAGMGDIPNAVEALERGIEKTGDERLRKMLDELQPPEETTVAAETETTTIEENTTITETTTETTTTMTEKTEVSGEPLLIYDTNASYIIDVISDKEAHIEIFSEIINDDFMVEYNPKLDKSSNLLMFRIQLDNISIDYDLWNFSISEYSDVWTWSNPKPATAQVFEWKEDGSGCNDINYFYDEALYTTYSEADTSQNKLSIDVTLSDKYDFSFNDYSDSKLEVKYYK